MNTFAITITPRLYETDAMGHINNATIAAWFEVARMRFLESLVERSPGIARDWILASVHIDFASETFYGADVTATITDAVVGNSSLTLHCEMFQGDRLTVRGKSVLVHIDPQTRAPSRVPDALRQGIAAL
ncbi:MAG: thioesterase family protein [Halioglobus sp.]